MSGIFQEGYFTETNPVLPGRAFSIKVLDPIAAEETDCHLAEIFRGEGCGLVLALDGRIQVAQNDEFMYHEMFAHTAAYAHEAPENILVIGGGNGGLVRELLKHPCVEHIDVCDIDGSLVELCKKHLPGTRKAMDNFKVDITIMDGTEFIRGKRGCYDLILVEGSESNGRDQKLSGKEFLAECKLALKPGGVLAAQAGSHILHTELVLKQALLFRDLFAYSGYFTITVPSFSGGSTGVCIGCDTHEVNRPVRLPFRRFVRSLKAYSSKMHKAAFVLPPFWNKIAAKLGAETE
ncbi:MAG: methyltransferase domain-containing protein [Lentisphaeria bacterium]|nr:methyltransferase domain-containing protein [Lentisphaeria bacterium]